ncbi:MAG: hypothetical protein WCC00_07755 [Candidatus Aminicenantales bacterium]
MTKALGVIGMVAGLALNAAGAEEKKVQFALTGTLMFGQDFDGEFGGLGGPGGRVDISLGKKFMVSPEAILALSWDMVATACTLNYRFGSCYAGLGPMVNLTDRSWKGDVFLKAHLGVKVDHWLIEAVYVAGGSPQGIVGERVALVGLTYGFAF